MSRISEQTAQYTEQVKDYEGARQMFENAKREVQDTRTTGANKRNNDAGSLAKRIASGQ